MYGHPQKHESDDLQDVLALLKELPRVSAPSDFNASLKARIAAAQAEANQFADITSLVKELPRVAAPADFDFKLRARIAQAKAEQQKSSAGWFAELFGQSFSWLQAGAAMAAVALVVSFVTFGVLRSDQGVDPQNSNAGSQVAVMTPAPEAPEAVAPSVEIKSTKLQTPIITSAAAVAARPRVSKQPSRAMTLTSGLETALPTMPARIAETGLVASKVMIKHQSGEARMVNLSEYNLGLQTAHLRSAQPKNNAGYVETAAMNIY